MTIVPTVSRSVAFFFAADSLSWTAHFTETVAPDEFVVREFSTPVADSKHETVKLLLKSNQTPAGSPLPENTWPEWVSFLYRSSVSSPEFHPYLWPEPSGHVASASFVKSNPLNNDYYVWTFLDDPWYPFIKEAHDRLTEIAPGYNIAQVKEKFFELRYYYDLPEGVSDEVHEAAREIVAEAEAKVYEWALKNNPEYRDDSAVESSSPEGDGS